MKTPKIKLNCEHTIHRDGTISYWSVFRQQWVREDVSSVGCDDKELAAMNPSARAEILSRAAGRSTHTYDTGKLYAMGYGDDGSETVDLTDAEVAAIAEAVGGTVAEIETARID